MIDDDVFFDRNAGLDLATVSDVNAFLQSPYSDDEISRLSQYLDTNTTLSLQNSRPLIQDLPRTYVSLLARSNGGGITIGEREIAYFEQESLRGYLIDYQFPIYMPRSLPFGLNGGGVFYVFDMREPLNNAEDYPILAAASGNLCYDDSPLVAQTLDHLLADHRNIEDLM